MFNQGLLVSAFLYDEVSYNYANICLIRDYWCLLFIYFSYESQKNHNGSSQKLHILVDYVFPFATMYNLYNRIHDSYDSHGNKVSVCLDFGDSPL